MKKKISFCEQEHLQVQILGDKIQQEPSKKLKLSVLKNERSEKIEKSEKNEMTMTEKSEGDFRSSKAEAGTSQNNNNDNKNKTKMNDVAIGSNLFRSQSDKISSAVSNGLFSNFTSKKTSKEKQQEAVILDATPVTIHSNSNTTTIPLAGKQPKRHFSIGKIEDFTKSTNKTTSKNNSTSTSLSASDKMKAKLSNTMRLKSKEKSVVTKMQRQRSQKKKMENISRKNSDSETMETSSSQIKYNNNSTANRVASLNDLRDIYQHQEHCTQNNTNNNNIEIPALPPKKNSLTSTPSLPPKNCKINDDTRNSDQIYQNNQINAKNLQNASNVELSDDDNALKSQMQVDQNSIYLAMQNRNKLKNSSSGSDHDDDNDSESGYYYQRYNLLRKYASMQEDDLDNENSMIPVGFSATELHLTEQITKKIKGNDSIDNNNNTLTLCDKRLQNPFSHNTKMNRSMTEDSHLGPTNKMFRRKSTKKEKKQKIQQLDIQISNFRKAKLVRKSALTLDDNDNEQDDANNQIMPEPGDNDRFLENFSDSNDDDDEDEKSIDFMEMSLRAVEYIHSQKPQLSRSKSGDLNFNSFCQTRKISMIQPISENRNLENENEPDTSTRPEISSKKFKQIEQGKSISIDRYMQQVITGESQVRKFNQNNNNNIDHQTHQINNNNDNFDEKERIDIMTLKKAYLKFLEEKGGQSITNTKHEEDQNLGDVILDNYYWFYRVKID